MVRFGCIISSQNVGEFAVGGGRGVARGGGGVGNVCQAKLAYAFYIIYKKETRFELLENV